MNVSIHRLLRSSPLLNEDIHKEDYSTDFDQTVVNMGNEIKSLQTKTLMLQAELKED